MYYVTRHYLVERAFIPDEDDDDNDDNDGDDEPDRKEEGMSE
jgi:hypothetical protein